ncbi:unnamed protein product [Toxocara canis]|uniref:Putative Xaa-Pro aminopeptidase 3 n=1 Tax=Toxocara canis TaxID=6265 RepID=A0A183V9T3_TOXCA|nr:unnamed protein product [Toxocara canis]
MDYDSDRGIEEGDVVLVDSGCDLHGYVSDITRVFPIRGQFSSAQRALCDALNDVQSQLLRIVEEVRPLRLSELYLAMVEALSKNLLEIGLFPKTITEQELVHVQATTKSYVSQILKFPNTLFDGKHVFRKTDKAQATDTICPHHVSHYLGMDVHDTASIPRNIPVLPGVTFTVEPGIYVRKDNRLAREEFRGIGMRIEDDVLVTENGVDVMTRHCARESTDIEHLMKL